jgi:hypothetical protein
VNDTWTCPRSFAPFACGDKTCNAGEVCLERAPGIRFEDGGTPPSFYECRAAPSQCSGNVTCACVQPYAQSQLMCWGSTCDDGDGNVRLGCMGM